MKTDTWLGAVATVTSILAGTMIGISVSGVASVYQWLSTWQTLIAGLLAVGAALLTVLQMQRSERAQSERHDQLMKLSTRPETLKVLRAHRMLTETFLNLGPRLQAAIGLYSHEFQENRGIPGKAFNPFEAPLGVLLDALNSAELDAVRPLLDPEATIELFAAQRLADITKANGSIFRNAFVAQNSPENAKDVDRAVAAALEVVSKLATQCTQFGNALKAMARAYETGKL